MPTTERYTLNDLQQATLDVMAAQLMPGDDEDLTRAGMTREEIISAVQQVPGQDEVTGNHMGPCLNCLKRRGLVAEASWPAKGKFHITARGITYVDLDGEPEPEVPRGEFAMEQVDKAVEEIEAEQQAPQGPSRDELLTKLAMEMAPEEWGANQEVQMKGGEWFGWNEYQLRREELINKPRWDDAPAWAQWLAQDSYGGWWWYDQKPVASDHDGSFDAPGQLSEISEGTILAGHDWRETLEARPKSIGPTAGASSTACDDQHRPEPADPGMPAPAGAPEVTILSVAVHPPGTAWLDSQETVIVKVDDLGAGPFLSLTTDGGPPTIESLAMLEAVTNTAFSLMREAEAREVGA